MLGKRRKRNKEASAAPSEPRFPLAVLARHRLGSDGKGVTTLVAGAGCPLRCAYCINKWLFDAKTEPVTAAELFSRVRIDDLYFRATGGGLTFGGGEALLHVGFYEAFRPLCGGWRLTAETCLNVPRENVVRAAKLFDAFIIDVKTFDPEIYLRYAGTPIGETEQNLQYLIETVGAEKLLVRVPLIPNYNDEKDAERTEKKLREMGCTNIERFRYVIRD